MKISVLILNNLIGSNHVDDFQAFKESFIAIFSELKEKQLDEQIFLDEELFAKQFGQTDFWELCSADHDFFTLFIEKQGKSTHLQLNAETVPQIINLIQNNRFITLGPNPLPNTKPNVTAYSRESFYTSLKNLLKEFPPEKESFKSEIEKLFHNLHFHTDLNSGLNGLNKSFKDIIQTIIYHLEKIDNDFFELYIKNKEKGASFVCEMLTTDLTSAKPPIEFSRDKNDKALFFYFNEGKDRRQLYCDLHSKFKGYIEFPALGECGDRIYFNQPIDKFLDGKILIARIGKHA
jgi:hypothetical protein